MEDPRGDSPDGMDGSNLEDGVGDGGFDPNDYEGVGDSLSPSTTASLLPPHIKAACIVYHYEEQEQ